MKTKKNHIKIKLNIILSLTLSLILFIATINLSFAITVSPQQIFITSDEITNNNIITKYVFMGTENKETKTISFSIPKDYSSNIFLEKKSITLIKEEKVKIILKNLLNLQSGEHNIKIDILENNENIINSLNDGIYLKFIVPNKNTDEFEEIEKYENNKELNNKQNYEKYVIYLIIIIFFSIIIFTIILIILFSTYKKNKKEKEELDYLNKELERIKNKLKSK